MNPSGSITLRRSQVREVDRRAIEEFGIPGAVLMENAGRNAATFILNLSRRDGPMAVVCGGGNNGGDGFVIARHLSNSGRDVEIYTASDPNRLAGDAAVNFRIVDKMSLPRHPFDSPERIAARRPHLHRAGVIVDAVLGTGFSGAIRPPLDGVIDAMNQAPDSVIVSIDAPSGLDCDNGQPAEPTVRAKYTVTFVARKLGFDAPGAETYTGEVVVADIGAPVALIREIHSKG